MKPSDTRLSLRYECVNSANLTSPRSRSRLASALAVGCATLFLSQQALAEQQPKPVTIENTPNVVIGNVPLPIFDADNAALQPHQASVQIHINSPDFESSAVLTTVPAEKRLVIETVTGLCFKGSPDARHRLAIETTGGGSTVEFHVPPVGVGVYGRRSDAGVFEGTFSTTSMSFGGPLKVYADSSTDVIARFNRNIGGGTTTCWMSIAGFFVDL